MGEHIFQFFAHVFRLLFVMGVGEVEQCGPEFESLVPIAEILLAHFLLGHNI
jgi:hypothetical protein